MNCKLTTFELRLRYLVWTFVGVKFIIANRQIKVRRSTVHAETIHAEHKCLQYTANFSSCHNCLVAVYWAIFILRKDVGVGELSRKRQFSHILCSENVLT